MRCFKKTFAFIIAGVLGMTYTYGNVPVYALEEENSTYSEQMEISNTELPTGTATGSVITGTPTSAAVTEIPAETPTSAAVTEIPAETPTSDAIIEVPAETTSSGAVTETDNPNTAVDPGVSSGEEEGNDANQTSPPGETVSIATKEPGKPTFSLSPIQTTAPTKTSTPDNTVSPVQTNTPGNTISPPKTNTPENTSSPVKTNVPENTVSPVRTNTPENTNSPIKTNAPSSVPQITEKPVETTIPVPTKETVRTSSPEKTLPPLATPINTQPAHATQAPEFTENSMAPATQSPAEQSEEQYCTITYQLNGGKNHKNNPRKIKKKGVKVTLNAPSRSKYTFSGWYTDKKFTHKITTLGNTSLSSITLYAKWKKVTVKQVVVSFARKKNSKNILVKVKKESKVEGFEYVYAKEIYFKKKYRVYTKKNPKTLSKLTKGKTYYIKVRAYKLDSTGKKVYGAYSRIKKVKL